MHQAVEEIIDKLIGAVKSDKPFYTLKDLLSAGIPSFIVERIRIEINDKLRQEFELKESSWADTSKPAVQNAWKDFQETLYAHSRIPKDKFYVVTGRVMNEIVKVYLEPRQHMAEYIYKGEEELNYDELVRRTDKLTIYKHFGKAIPLYMKKRKLSSLEKKRCKLLIHNLDANLVASYSAKDWAQVLELLFTLFAGKIDAKLIQLFFEDKGLYLTAKAFNALDEEITKERFIEILSYPDLLDVKLQEKFRDQFREELIAQKNRFDHPDEDEVEVVDEKEQRLLDSFFGDYKASDPQMTDQESFNALFKSEQNEKSIFEEFEETPDAEEISRSLKSGEQTDEIKKFRQNLVTVLDQAAHSFKNLDEDEEEDAEDEEQVQKKPQPKKDKPKVEPDDEEEIIAPDETDDLEPLIAEEPEEDGEEEDQPMWQQFLRPDQMDVLMGSSDTDEDELIDEDSLFENAENQAEDNKINEKPDLEDFIVGQEGVFVKQIFGGKKKKYKTALKKIQDFGDWDTASEFIHEHIFSPNEVDMFSDIAVEFTDRLQSYFEEYKS
ncbi:hypothetical protein [Gracilimonas tropica]|uniref:hypothetical protein n=1 Tax=Gracilimonas tropica TaxID=454600 RepID=UPI0012F734A7|nr:hypothetical protein [Gracilimonas tropica]